MVFILPQRDALITSDRSSLTHRREDGESSPSSLLFLSLYPGAQSVSGFPCVSLSVPSSSLSSLLIPLSLYQPVSHYQPDPLLILILLPHSSITHFSHFCIYTKDDGLCFVFMNPPTAPSSNPPNMDLPNLCLLYPSLLYRMSSFVFFFLGNLRGQAYGGNEDWGAGGANSPTFCSSKMKMLQVSSRVGVAKMGDVGLCPVSCCF